MSRLRARTLLTLLFAVAPVVPTGCSRLGPIGPGLDSALWRDAPHLVAGDEGGPGPLRVAAVGVSVDRGENSFNAVLYRPADLAGQLPAIVFLPGYLAPEDQYEGYARALASRGFLVAVHGRFSPFVSDGEMTAAARTIADWLIAEQGADANRIGVAGHSMGGKAAVLAAAEDPRFRAIVSIDPDDRGDPPVDAALRDLEAPLLLIGAEVSWKAASFCADRNHNYERFFEKAPVGTVELTLLGADHVQVMDDPEAFGLSLCRCGTADSRAVRTIARRATVHFFLEHLAGRPASPFDLGGIGRLRVRTLTEGAVPPRTSVVADRASA